MPSWINEECYIQKVQPRLRTVKIREISEAYTFRSLTPRKSVRADADHIQDTGWCSRDWQAFEMIPMNKVAP
jgi:hypothetical protein